MRFAFLKTAAVGCALALSCFAQESVTVPQLIEFIKSSIKQKLPDKDVAAEVAKLHLTQKLEDQTIEDLQTAGAGLRTVAALTHLADLSAKLPAAPPPEQPKPVATGGPPPSEKDQKRIIEAVREYALNYTKGLPDFLCVQQTRRSINRNYKPGDQAWSPQDHFSEQLNYLDHHETYHMLSVNDNSTFGKDFNAKVGGALSRGEWASLMQAVFDPSTDTFFDWSRWTNLGGKKYYVFRYQVDKAHSRETLEADGQTETPPFHGEIYVPMDLDVVWRITVEPESSAGFPLQDVKEVLKYDFITISGQEFLLPITSEVVMRTGRIGSRNEIAFKLYQKYSADTIIKFDDVDTPPQGATPPPGDNTKKPPHQ